MGLTLKKALYFVLGFVATFFSLGVAPMAFQEGNSTAVEDFFAPLVAFVLVFGVAYFISNRKHKIQDFKLNLKTRILFFVCGLVAGFIFLMWSLIGVGPKFL